MQVESERDDRGDGGERNDRGDAGNGDNRNPRNPARAYRLTHEYLLDPLRTWIEDGDRKTRRGRAKLALRQRTRDWKGSNPTDQAKRDRTYLPGPWEYLGFCAWPRGANSARTKRTLMRAAHRRYAGWTAGLAIGVLMIALTSGFWAWDQVAAMGVETRLSATAAGIPTAIDNLDFVWLRAQPRLERDVRMELPSDRRRRAIYALAKRGQAGQDLLDWLVDQVVECPPDECPHLAEAVSGACTTAIRFWDGMSRFDVGITQRMKGSTNVGSRATPGPTWYLISFRPP